MDKFFIECVNLLNNKEMNKLHENLFVKAKDVRHSRIDLLRGVYFMNRGMYTKASEYLWAAMINSPFDKMIHDNLMLLPTKYQDKKFIINLEGYYGINHSFSVILESYLDYLLLSPNIEVRLDRKDLHLISFTDNSIYEKVKPIDKNEMVDLTIRLTFPFDLKPSDYSKKTLVFIVTEHYNAILEDKMLNYNYIYDNRLYLMTPSEQSKEIFQKRYPEITDDIISVIPHGINYTRWSLLSKDQVNKKRKELKIDENDFVFLNISSGLGNKNLQMVVDSFMKIKEVNKKLILKVNTKLYNVDNVKTFLDNINDDNIIIINKPYSTKEMNDLYNLCDCYVCPYNAEGFNVPALEAQSYGKIVISTRGVTDEFLYRPDLFGLKSKRDKKYIYHINEEELLNKMELAINYKNDNFKNELISYTLENFSYSGIIDRIIDGYLNSHLYINLLNLTISNSKNKNNVVIHDDDELRIIKRFFMKFVNLTDINIRLNSNVINIIHKMNVYTVLFDFNYGGDNFIKNIYCNRYSRLNNYKINNIYKSMITDEFFKSLEVIARKEQVFSECINLVDFFKFEDYLCLTPYTYFVSTYLTNHKSRFIKSSINENISNAFKKNNIFVTNNPIKKDGKYDIAIVGTLGDFTGNAVYRFIKNQIINLSKIFRIHLIIEDEIKKEQCNVDKEIRDYIESITCVYIKADIGFLQKFYEGKASQEDLKNNIYNFDKILNNNFLCCYFLVIGCRITSIYLSNLKIAPIQFSGYGHPISSFGSCNNYYIMSPDIENKSIIRRNYTEFPLFVNNLTTVPKINNYVFNKGEIKRNHIVLSCTFKKLTPDFISFLNRVSKKYDERLTFHFYTGPCNLITDCFQACSKVVASKNYDTVIEISNKSYDDYMKSKSECYMAFDSYPYAGFTTILENLKIGLPTIVYKGNEVVNRFSTFIYNKLGLRELIVGSYDDYEILALNLLTNKQFYNDVKRKIENIDLDKFFEDINCDESFDLLFKKLINEYENKTLIL